MRDRPGTDPDALDLLAHDIRAAVSDVIGGLRLIEPGDLSNDAREQVGRVHVAAELLARLVEEMLAGAPLGDEAAQLPDPDEVLNLHRFLDDELRRWHGAARPTGTRVTLLCDENVPEVVRLNGLRLRRIIANLMGNALRHTPGGTVELGCAVYEGGTLSLCVSDDGPGFPEDLLPRLFEARTRGRASAGSGMGLHIAAAHAEGLGGQMVARNLASGGARVTLNIPASCWQRTGAPEENTVLPDLTGRRVLIADDSATNRALVRGMLGQLGAESETAANGIEALNWFSRERFDLALIDLEMPQLGGLDVIRSERERQVRGIAPPVVMLAMTSFVLSDNREAILEAGADGLVAKPVGKLENFARILQHHLEQAPDPADWAPEMAPPVSAITLAELIAVAGPDEGGNLLARLGEDLAGVETALTEALGRADRQAIVAQTHVLLSLSGAIGALPTSESARRLTQAVRTDDGDAVQIAGKVCLGRLAELRAELAKAGDG